MPHIQALVIDEDFQTRQRLGNILGGEGVRVSLASESRQGLTLLAELPFDVLFAALSMPEVDGLPLVRRAMQIRPQVSAVVVSARARLQSCLKAMRLGACDYLTKPFTPETVRASLSRALDTCRQRTDGSPVRPRATKVPAPASCMEQLDGRFVAETEAMRRIADLVVKIAPTAAAVLVCGESGVGKEVVARAVHRQSRRAAGPFVHVACGAIPEAEIEPRLFGGHRRALESNGQVSQGLLGYAHGGTIFLANVDRLPMWCQIRLFDAFRTGKFRPPGAFETPPLDVRVVASTARDLETAAAEGRFDDGLYHLLNAVVIAVPPLRRRRQDVKLLAERCLAEISLGQGVAPGNLGHRFTDEAWDCLLGYDWPGNLTELRSVVARAVALSDGPVIDKGAVDWIKRKPCRPAAETISVPLTPDLRAIERSIVEEVVLRCRGNKAAAARALGIHRRTLYRVLDEGVGNPRAGQSRAPTPPDR